MFCRSLLLWMARRMKRFCRALRSTFLPAWIGLSTFGVFWIVSFLNTETIYFSSIEGSHAGLVVDTPTCKIPDIHPFDRSIKNMTHHLPPLTCKGEPPLTYIDGKHLRINWVVLEHLYLNDLKECEMYEILRPNSSNKDNVFTLAPPVVFGEDIEVTAEFMKVVCHGNMRSHMYTNFHTIVHRKQKVEFLKTHRYDKFLGNFKPNESLNILVIGIDSMSRLNFARHLPRTREFIKTKMRAIEFNAYNKIADNKFPNLVALLSGQFRENLPWAKNPKGSFDSSNFLWNEFGLKGYRTVMAEDWASMATFNNQLEGFHKQPTDYYLRPFSLAIDDPAEAKLWNNSHNCFIHKAEGKIVFDYLLDFVKEFRFKPYFGYSFLSRITHVDFNNASLAEEMFLDFFEKLKAGGYMKKTVVFLVSDTGGRTGVIKNTYTGRIEERMPMLYAMFPPFFYTKYPLINETLHTNIHRLVTPFDVHSTILDILNFKPNAKKPPRTNKGISLLEEIPLKRTCEDAGIKSEWCTCHYERQMSIHEPVIRNCSRAMVARLNDLVEPKSHICARLALRTVLAASRIKPIHPEILLRGKPVVQMEYIRLMIIATPGDGRFEATIQHDPVSRTNYVKGVVSRLNAFGPESDCVHDTEMKKLCFCDMPFQQN